MNEEDPSGTVPETTTDLRAWLDAVESRQDLQRISVPVDPNEEMGAIAYSVGRTESGPALLFENPIGARRGARWLFNMLGGSIPRIAMSLGLPPDTSAQAVIRECRDLYKRRLAPCTVAAADAPIMQNVVRGESIDLSDFVPPKMWPFDGGPYLGTGDIVLTRDPDLGHVNCGTYRMMLHGARSLGLYLSPGKDARLHITRYWSEGRDVPIVAVFGIHPMWLMVGGQKFPANCSELDVIGGIAGRPLATVDGPITGLPIPAFAEVAIEGYIRANSASAEGPFGEFTGYYAGPEGAAPVVDVQAVYFRDDPILTAAMPGDYPGCDYALPTALARSARVWEDFDRLGVPGIVDVWCVPAAAAGFGMIVIALEQRYAGHAAQVLALAAQMPGAAYYTKWIVAVDEDVNPRDLNQVVWAMSTRCSPVDDIDVLRQTWSTWLDPTLNPPEVRPWGSKALINACKEHRYLPTFARRTRVRAEVADMVRRRWSTEYGLDGTAPDLPRETEGDDGAGYHESNYAKITAIDADDSTTEPSR